MQNLEILRDIIVPIIIAFTAMGVVWFVIDLTLKLIKLNYKWLKIILALVAWHFLGQIVYTWVLRNIVIETYIGIEALFRPFIILIKILF